MSLNPQAQVRCCIISPYSKQDGGAELSLLHLLEHGQQLNVKWSVAYFEHGPMVHMSKQFGIDCCVLNLTRLRDPVRLPIALGKLIRFIASQRCDVVLGWVSHMGYLASISGMACRAKSMWFQKGGVTALKPMSRWLVDKPVAGILANSVHTAHAQAAVLPSKPIFIAPSGVDIERFRAVSSESSEASRIRLGLPTDVPLILMVGRLQRWKGFHTLLRAMPTIRAKFPTAQALIVGSRQEREPEYADELRRLSDDLKLNNAIIFAGAVPHDDVPSYFNACDVFVHGSHHEPFGIVVIESMALGKPTIASPHGGPGEIIQHGVNGILVEPEQPAKLADEIIGLLADSQRAKRLGDAGRLRAADYSVSTFSRRVGDAVKMVSSHDRIEPGIYLDGRRIGTG